MIICVVFLLFEQILYFTLIIKRFRLLNSSCIHNKFRILSNIKHVGIIIFNFVWIFWNIWFWPFTILASIVDSWIRNSSLTSYWFSRVKSSILVDSTLACALFISRHCYPISSHSVYSRMTCVSWRILYCTIRWL